jgi:hypothetical protein
MITEQGVGNMWKAHVAARNWKQPAARRNAAPCSTRTGGRRIIENQKTRLEVKAICQEQIREADDAPSMCCAGVNRWPVERS